MNVQDIYLLCFVVGTLWSLLALFLGGVHFGHFGHGHVGHSPVAPTGRPHAGRLASPGDKAFRPGATPFSYLLNPNCAAIFLAWFGGVGYLLARHTGLGFWIGIGLAAALGSLGAWILASFLRFLTAQEQPLDPADYELVGVLGRVSAPIRAGGVGELIYIRDGTRRALSACSENGREIGRNEEVVVMRYEKGIAYVKPWDSLTH